MDPALTGSLPQLQHAAEDRLVRVVNLMSNVAMNNRKGLDKKAKRMVLGLALLAVGFYVGFILMTAFVK